LNDVKPVTSSRGLLLACEGDDTSDGSDVNAVAGRGSIVMDIAMVVHQVGPSNRICGSRLTNKVMGERASGRSVDEGKGDLNSQREKG
jgi:hypothetical protein